MRKVKDAVDLTTNEKIYFKGHAKATYLSDGRNVEEALGEIPSAKSDVFVAVYGETTYDEIVTAYEENRMIYLNKDNMQYVLQYKLPTAIYFVSTYQKYHYQVACTDKDIWYSQRLDLNNFIEDADNGNIKVTIDSKTREVVTPQNVGKQGVIRQTQTWTQAADKSYSYVMSNLVRGAIPQANIDLFTSAGAVFNEESGYFELNGLTDISYEEMQAIYNAGYKMAEGYWDNKIRTNIFRPCNVYNVDAAASQYGFTGMYTNRNCTAEVFKFTEQEIYGVALKNQMYGTYENCIYLKTFGKGVFVCLDSNISDQAFNKCYSLETIYLRNLKKNVWFKDSARLSIASVLYMVANSAATSAIVITLHADAYARAMADADIQAALEAHPNVSLASA